MTAPVREKTTTIRQTRQRLHRHRTPIACGAALAALLAGSFAVIDRSTAEPKPDPRALGVREITVTATPIRTFDRTDSARYRFGKFTFLGGLRLSSPEKSFGGWSGIAIDPDGRNLIAVSDAGLWMTARLGHDDGRPATFENARTGPLKAMSGSPLGRERDRDAEAVELVAGTTKKGQLLIAFEQNHRIGRFDIGPGGVAPPTSYIRPDNSRGTMDGLKGFEAMTILTTGRYRGSIVAIAEHLHDSSGNHTGWFWTGAKANAFTLTDIGGYDIIGMAELPGGDLVLLERRFNWLEGIKMRLRRVALAELKPGAKIEGEVLLEATMAQDIDNMEGLSIHQDQAGSTILTLISDDNFNQLFQRTILLQFKLQAGEDEQAGVR
ncbi:MAG: esterase-like activity of phytase family protein [Alphaproteobacteria bacterium]|nr:esterase-like activity of phytase family protein [Alphaproteobacteria bacterium]